MRYYHILALGLMVLFGACRQYEDMPDDRNLSIRLEIFAQPSTSRGASIASKTSTKPT